MSNLSIITITDLGFAYPGSSSTLFEHLSATLDRGWTALLGDNGCGKTTSVRTPISDQGTNQPGTKQLGLRILPPGHRRTTA